MNASIAPGKLRLIAVVCVGFLTLALLAVLPAGGAAAAQRDPASDHVRLPQQCLTTSDKTPSDPIVCNLNVFYKNRPTVVLWGDSHMWMMIPAIKRAARGKPVNLVTFIMGACPPGNPALTPRQRRTASPCELTNDRAMRFVRTLQKRNQPVSVILGSFWGLYLQANKEIKAGQQPTTVNATSAEFFRRSTPALFKWLGKKGVPVDVDAQGPAVPATEPTCARGTLPWSCSVPRSRAIFAERATNRFLATNIRKLGGQPRYIDVSRSICNSRTCPARIGGVFTWWDKLHISATKSETLSGFFAPTIKAQARRYRPRQASGSVGPNCRIPIIAKPCIPRG